MSRPRCPIPSPSLSPSTSPSSSQRPSPARAHHVRSYHQPQQPPPHPYVYALPSPAASLEEQAAFPSRLLALPRELRDQILFYVLTTPLAAPRSPSSSIRPAERIPLQFIAGGTSRSRDGRSSRRRRPTGHRRTVLREAACVLVAPSSATRAAAPAPALLLVCRQLYAETRAVMLRLSAQRRLCYEMDVMFVKGRGLWPTWLSWPCDAPAGLVDVLRAQFRICDPPSLRHDNPYTHAEPDLFAWHGGDTPALSMVFALLLAFLRDGPRLSARSGGRARLISPDDRPTFAVRILILDVLLPNRDHPILASGCHDGATADGDAHVFAQWSKHAGPDSDFAWIDPAADGRKRDDAATWRRRVAAEKLCYFLSHCFQRVLGRHASPAVQQLYDCVGRIEFRVDGALRRSLDLHEPVFLGPHRRASQTRAQYERMSWFREWVYQTQLTRWRAGLVDHPPAEPIDVDGPYPDYDL